MLMVIFLVYAQDHLGTPALAEISTKKNPTAPDLNIKTELG